MRIDLDLQEREVIKNFAKSMATVLRRDMGGRSRNAFGVDAASIVFWERLVSKMEEEKTNV